MPILTKRFLQISLYIGIGIFLSQWSGAQEIRQVFWATPEWTGYTNKDGTGFYNEILRKVFEGTNFKLQREYFPWQRCKMLVKTGKLDFTGADEFSSDFYLSKFPIVISKEQVIYKKANITEWKGIVSLKEKKGIWPLGYLDSFGDQQIKQYLKGSGNTSRIAALEMMILDRADYYLDNDVQLLETINQLPKNRHFNIEDYQIRDIKTIPLFMLFAKNEKGAEIKSIYDQRFEILYRSGELEVIYKKYKENLPKLSDFK